MPEATKSSASGNNHLSQVEETVPSSQEELSSSEQEPDPEVSFHQVRPPQPVPSMFMPCIEGPKMDWKVNDGLYHGFLKWCKQGATAGKMNGELKGHSMPYQASGR